MSARRKIAFKHCLYFSRSDVLSEFMTNYRFFTTPCCVSCLEAFVCHSFCQQAEIFFRNYLSPSNVCKVNIVRENENGKWTENLLSRSSSTNNTFRLWSKRSSHSVASFKIPIGINSISGIFIDINFSMELILIRQDGTYSECNQSCGFKEAGNTKGVYLAPLADLSWEPILGSLNSLIPQ